MTNTRPWIATRYGMSCRITTEDFLARLDDGAEQITETTYLWRGWVIQSATHAAEPVRVEESGVHGESSFAEINVDELDIEGLEAVDLGRVA